MENMGRKKAPQLHGGYMQGNNMAMVIALYARPRAAVGVVWPWEMTEGGGLESFK